MRGTMLLLRRVTIIALAGALGGCTSPDDPSGDMHLVLVQGPTAATAGTTLPQSILVRVMDGDGKSVSGVPVTWAVALGGGSIRPSADSSGVDGLAAAQWTLGLGAGTNQIGVTIYGEPALSISVEGSAFHADKVDAGFRSACGLQGTALWCWGWLPLAPEPRRELPSLEVKEVAVSDADLCVLDLGGVTHCRSFYDQPGTSWLVNGLPPLRALSSGDSWYCGIAAVDALVWCWRFNLGWIANRISPTLQLETISTGNQGSCGMAVGGGAWCWSFGSPPERVPGMHSFRAISAGGQAACAIEGSDNLYCWPWQGVPQPMPGVSAVQVAMGLGVNLVNAPGGVSVFYYFAGSTPAFQLAPEKAFPFPTLSISGDDTPCLIVYDHTVYCLGLFDDFDALPSTWTAIPAESPEAP